ncbi:MAG: hypothetical protein WBM62_07800 [Crocosphaera sp.]
MRQDLSNSERYDQMQGLSISESLSEGLIDVDDLIPNYSSFDESDFDDFDDEEGEFEEIFNAQAHLDENDVIPS